MVDAHQAVKLAFDYLKSFFDPAWTGKARLEEIEMEDSSSASGGIWKITISLVDPDVMPWDSPSARIYKTVAVSQTDGQIRSMKIRELSAL